MPKILKKIATYLLLLGCLVLLRLSNFPLSLSFGLFVGALYCLNPYLSTLTFVVSSTFFGLDSIFITLSQGAVMLLLVVIYSLANKKIRKLVLICYIILAQIFYLMWHLYDTQELFMRFINVAISIIFSFVSIYVIRAIFVRGIKYKLGLDEQICLAVMVVCLVSVISKFYIVNFQIIRFFAPLIILLALNVYGSGACFCASVTLGIGCAIASGSITDVGIFCLWSMGAVAFYALSRYLSAVAILLVELVLIYFFKAYGVNNALIALPVLISCAIYCAIPTKTITFFADTVGNCKEQYSSRHIINRLRANLSKRLFELSDIFFQMHLTFKSMVKGVLPPDKAVIAISREVCDTVCKDCAERTKCWRVNLPQTEQDFCEIVGAAMDRGKANLLDLSSALASRCIRVNSILSAVNSEVATYKQYYLTASSSDNSRLLIGEQLSGVSTIMMQLSEQCKGTIVFEKDKEKTILEQLTFCNVLTKEVVIWEEKGELFVTLTVAKSDASKDILLQVVSKNVNRNMIIDAVETVNNDDNWLVLHLKPKPNFNVAFGFANRIKAGSEISGDTHSFIKINKDKFLLALCDGMGSGENAERASNVAISLVENFYKAGFDNDVILSSVNRLLACANEETFTAVDICVVNLEKGLTDFIKLGSPSSLVKCNNIVQFIAGGSLPLGVLEEMKPILTKKALGLSDIIMLYSDGFYDAFEDKNEIARILESTTLSNPQVIADEFMKIACDKIANVPKDDMTIIVARITN